MNPKDNNSQPLTMKEFKKAVKQIAKSPKSETPLYENRHPTKKELNLKFKIVLK